MNLLDLSATQITKLPLERVTVIQDTREKHPWDLSPLQVQVASLATGDYSSLCRRYLLERKNSVDELISCMTIGRDRFERELERMQAFASAIVVVEGTYTDLAMGCYRSKMKKDSALATLVAWQQRYQIPFQFCGTRDEAERFARSYFHQQFRNHLTALLEVQQAMAEHGQELSL